MGENGTEGTYEREEVDPRVRLVEPDEERRLVRLPALVGVGFVGAGGRGTAELFGVLDRVDLVTGTLGKALGGASGGYVAGPAEVVDLLRQRSRPYLFSNAVAPAGVAGSMKASIQSMASSARSSERW